MSNGSREPSCLFRIRSRYQQLHAAEQSVARVVLDRPDLTVTATVGVLARRANVARATVIRFCQGVGYTGFLELRHHLAGDLAATIDQIHEEITQADDPVTIARKILIAHRTALEETLFALDSDAVRAAVEALTSAKSIDIYGIGSSGPLAVDAFYRLFRIGMPVSAFTDSHMMSVAAARLGPGDVALAISHTGSTRETLEAVTEAKRAGATILCITSHSDSSIGQAADICLVTRCQETAFRREAMSSRIAQLSMVDALYAAVAVQRLDRSAEALDRSNRIIQGKRQGVPSRP